MIKTKEILLLILITFILAVSFSFLKTTEIFLYSLLFIFLALLINIFAKKIISSYLDSRIEVKLWEVKQWGFKAHQYFKKPFPAGIFFPLILSAISFGNILWMACTIFEIKPKIHRAAKRHGLYSFSEMTEQHIGFIAAAGVIANLIFAVIGYLVGLPAFAKLNVYLALFNMIPISELDGNKIFFGNIILWSFLAILTLIGLGYAFFLI